MKTLEIILIGFFLLLMVFGFILARYSTSEGSKCVIDPLTYYETKHKDLCSCFCSGQLYAGQNYASQFKQYNTNKDNVNLSPFNETFRDLG